MGTNFYAIYNKCEHCKRSERLHIGKRSAGWEFMFRSHKEKGLVGAAAWREWLDVIGADIIANGERYDREGFWSEVEATRGRRNQADYALNEYPYRCSLLVPGDDYKDPAGWAFHCSAPAAA